MPSRPTIVGEKPVQRPLRCTDCLSAFVYDEGACSWYGIAECQRCGEADVDRVLCHACTRRTPEAVFLDSPKRSRKEPAP